MTAKRDAIRSIYDQVDAPDWAATNLDALADILRDLSWLPPGPVAVNWSPSAALDPADRLDLERVLRHAVRETAHGPHPVALV